MTIDYASPTLNQYKALIRKEANLYGDIRIAAVCGDYMKARGLKQEKKLMEIRIRIIEAAFVLKNKKKKGKATA
ncbi:MULTISPECIES: RNA polymerase subunit sigma [Bacillus]|uniref:RNA polymerase subunit sigma n=1 Tax=Bacillus TaxID=1386 RepID=UPI0009952B31|nr:MULTISPECIES: RNA polymerase subunit sigma [Bacillus cereus group]MRC29227.1 RNA polymerase subunit sigma [Bacillus thuringiensis]OUB35193.1 RNA polymerase subunit sigma [Bacillus thuringiensis serovar yunnanensis]OPA43496.1 RNA polymerase subunit sigma [Bacillus cereus]PDZ35839.1 RNA polymerase subunit sigma [Bacillus toyonensis]PEJ15468.1 RNA polymerase subunit sigma [Bacillus toyonensis]